MDNCSLCNANDWHTYGKTGNHNVIICKNCTFTRLDPVPSIPELTAFYATQYRKESGEEKVDQVVLDYEQRRAKAILPHLEDVDTAKVNRILDIGCSTGTLLSNLKDKFSNAELNGIEFNKIYIDYIKEKNLVDGSSIHQAPIEEVSSQLGEFDLVTMVHVLEHVQKPDIALEHINKVMKEGAYLYIEVPNMKTPYAKLMGEYFITYHLSYFTEKTLAQMLTKFGFSIEKTIVQNRTSIGFVAQKSSNTKPDVKYDDFNSVKSKLDRYNKWQPTKDALFNIGTAIGLKKLKRMIVK